MTAKFILEPRTAVIDLLLGWQFAYPERSQGCQILEAFKLFEILTPDEMYKGLDVMNAKACIYSLRKRGHKILTRWYLHRSPAGQLRRRACYKYIRNSGELR